MDPCLNPNIPTPLSCIPNFFSNIAQSGLTLAGVAAVFFITLSGIKFLTSGGNPEKVAGAKKSLTFALAGLIIVLLAFVILKFIAQITGVDCKVLGLSGCK